MKRDGRQLSDYVEAKVREMMEKEGVVLDFSDTKLKGRIVTKTKIIKEVTGRDGTVEIVEDEELDESMFGPDLSTVTRSEGGRTRRSATATRNVPIYQLGPPVISSTFERRSSPARQEEGVRQQSQEEESVGEEEIMARKEDTESSGEEEEGAGLQRGVPLENLNMIVRNGSVEDQDEEEDTRSEVSNLIDEALTVTIDVAQDEEDDTTIVLFGPEEAVQTLAEQMSERSVIKLLLLLLLVLLILLLLLLLLLLCFCLF